MNNQPILFYSDRCAHSKQILDTLKMVNKEGLCRLFSIDGKTRAQLPPFLKGVPTLYVPESKDIYTGKDIFAYIAKPVVARREVPTQQAIAAQQPVVQDLAAWSFEGAGSMTETYSSWDRPGQFTSQDQLSFSFLGAPMNTPAPAPEPTTKQSFDGNKQGRNDDINSRLEQYKKMRESEFKGISRQ